MADALAPPTIDESQASVTETPQADAIRNALADTYSFVRGAEVNKTISSFTLDHYIDAAMRKIKDTRVLQAANGPSGGIGTRPSQLDTLTKLQQDFDAAYSSASQSAQQSNQAQLAFGYPGPNPLPPIH